MRRRKAKRKMNDKQALTVIISVVVAAVLLIGALVVIGPILGGNENADPHAGHNHGEGEHYEGDGHDHSAAKVKYQLYTNADKTYRVVFLDAHGKTVSEINNIPKMPIKETVDADKGIYTLGWASGDGPNDFYHVYYNEKTGQVSEQIHAPRGTDGVRIAYGSEDQTKIIVQDLFDKNSYYKEHPLNNVGSEGDIIRGGQLQSDKKTVVIPYVDKNGKSQHAKINLYA